MQQISMNLEELKVLDEIFMESENQDHKNIVNFNMIKDIKKGILLMRANREKMIDWFCDKFFKFDLEISCEDLFEIAQKNGIKFVN